MGSSSEILTKGSISEQAQQSWNLYSLFDLNKETKEDTNPYAIVERHSQTFPGTTNAPYADFGFKHNSLCISMHLI